MPTVRVRIAVAVDPDGDWNSCGWKGGGDENAMEICTESIGSGEARYWLEADLPVPEIATIQAAVTKDEGGT